MSADMTELKKILEQNIGDVYKNALVSIGDPAAAMEVTRRVMALLKRTHEAGLSVTPDTIKRLTEDCCREQSSYNSKKASFRDGVIADMPDFDTAISSITKEEADAKGRSDAEDRAAEAYRAASEAAAIAASAQRPQPQAMGPRAEQSMSGEDAPRRRYTCVADIFEGFDRVIYDVINAEPEQQAEMKATEPAKIAVEKKETPQPQEQPEQKPEKKTEKKTEKKPRKKSRRDDDDDDELDMDLLDDDDDDDDDDDIEPLFEKKQRAPVAALIGAWLLIAILLAVVFCLAIMLMERDVVPGGDSSFVKTFADWFNSHIFPLF